MSMTVLAQIGSENVSKFTCILYWYCVVIDGGHCVGREDKVLIPSTGDYLFPRQDEK